MEKESDSYRSSQLLKKIKDLEAMVGRVSMEVSYYKAVVEQASIAYKTDIEKKFATLGYRTVEDLDIFFPWQRVKAYKKTV